MSCEIRKFGDLNELSASVAENIGDLVRVAAGAKGKFTLALSGGSTPRTLYHILATSYRDSIPWEAVHFFWGDERYVPRDDSESNFRMAKETLLDLAPIPRGNVHPIPTSYSGPEQAARLYEEDLRKFFDDTGSTFDLVLLGMGKEGHTASLFPKSPALDEQKRWVTAVEAPARPSTRITLTLPVLNRASAVYFLVSGREKADALGKVFDTATDPHDCPAKALDPSGGKLIWWIDSTLSNYRSV